ncbi:calcium:proton antiporter [Kocuria tytonicola]|uniref:Calcium:proton antiporter n=1 Tax=Kocuria tytonicola TaxID=2055946 RepID=A0A3L9L6B1_9MICC|nr:calcium:proton antiporter [Kocuria tytonicola]RLY94543.1 calcium:proton antiporter [Kocuria tytonicola]
MLPTLRRVLTPLALARLAVGWLAVVVLALLSGPLTPPVPVLPLVLALAAIVGVILFASTGVVAQAEHVAERLGDPYGSLVLTLSIVVVEVVLISAVMLGPGEHGSIARDSVMAVAMIILDLVIGLCLVVGGLRHGGMVPNHAGAAAYLSLLLVLGVLAFALPATIGQNGSYLPWQSVPVVALVLGGYAFFLRRQTGVQAGDFTEVDPRIHRAERSAAAASPSTSAHGSVFHEHRAELLSRLALLVLTALPVVLLSHSMAALLDDGLGRLGAPSALAGVLIAGIVFLPESITSVRAALAGELQRVSNLCHGALVSTLGLTIPAVLVIGMFTGQPVVLAPEPADLVLLTVSLLLSVVTFTAPRATAVHGVAHLALFAAYALAVLS